LSPQISIQNQIASFFGIRFFHCTRRFAAFLFASWDQWRLLDYRRRFSLRACFVLYLFHLCCAGENYCVQCLTAYTVFFLCLVWLFWLNHLTSENPPQPGVVLIIIVTWIIRAALAIRTGRYHLVIDLRLPIILAILKLRFG
jgi:hypothetical protein